MTNLSTTSAYPSPSLRYPRRLLGLLISFSPPFRPPLPDAAIQTSQVIPDDSTGSPGPTYRDQEGMDAWNDPSHLSSAHPWSLTEAAVMDKGGGVRKMQKVVAFLWGSQGYPRRSLLTHSVSDGKPEQRGKQLNKTSSSHATH